MYGKSLLKDKKKKEKKKNYRQLLLMCINFIYLCNFFSVFVYIYIDVSAKRKLSQGPNIAECLAIFFTSLLCLSKRFFFLFFIRQFSHRRQCELLYWFAHLVFRYFPLFFPRIFSIFLFRHDYFLRWQIFFWPSYFFSVFDWKFFLDEFF